MKSTWQHLSKFCNFNHIILEQKNKIIFRHLMKKGALFLSCLLMILSAGTAQADGFSTDVLLGDSNQPGSVQYVEFTVFTGGSFQLDNEGFVTLGTGYNSDPYMYLFTNSIDLANIVDFNDDGGVGLNSQLILNLDPGKYIIAVSQFNLTANEAVSGLNDLGDPQSLLRVTVFSADGIVAQGFVTLGEFLSISLRSASNAINVGDFLTSLPFNGSHHRPLLTYHGLENGKCAWATGDFAGYTRNHDGDAQVGEIGGCYDFIPQKLRFGVGVGYSNSNQDLAFGGKSKLNGPYTIAELDYLLSDIPVIASLTGIYGEWDGDVDRAYSLGGTISTSFGNTNVTSYGLRGRLDWLDAFHYSDINFSPRVSVTVIHNKADSYTETGGLFPATFNSRSHTSEETRFGIDAEKQLDNATWLRGMIEGVYRFDGRDPSVTGIIGGTVFALRGNDNKSLWGRVGLEVEHLIQSNIGISASINGSSEGEDPTVSGGISLRVGF